MWENFMWKIFSYEVKLAVKVDKTITDWMLSKAVKK